jgi:dipeptidyl aminopeptidase/acylaminoacyl peptidase
MLCTRCYSACLFRHFHHEPRHDFGRLAYIQSGDIYVKELPKGRPLRLTQDGLNSTPRFSPSGKWLAFRKAEGELWVTKSNGQSSHLIHSGKIRHFKWAPDTDLWIMKADSSGKRQLTSDDGEREECPLWLADGRRILFARVDAHGQPSLWLIRQDGKSLQKMTEALSAYYIKYGESLDFYGYFNRRKVFDLYTAIPNVAIAKTWTLATAVLLLAVTLAVVGILFKKGRINENLFRRR